MKNLFYSLLLILFFFASCKIKTHVHFNKDHSGTVSITYDMTEFVAESGGQDSTGFIDSMGESLKKLDTLGILKNYKVVKTAYGIEVSYSFENMEQLNGSFNRFLDGDSEFERAGGKFTAKGKKISYEIPVSKEKKEEDPESSMDMEGLFDWEFSVSFEQKIKKCSNKNFTVDKNKNSISTSGGLSKFQNPEMMNFTVKLK